MIKKVVIRRFKRFDEVIFDLPGHVVIAGPNNTGKTTVLQAIAAWHLALNQWKTLNDFQRHGGGYTKKPIARQTFSSVPLSTYELLWKERQYAGSIEVEIHSSDGWALTMEFIADSTEQIYVRPKPSVDPQTARNAHLDVVFVPPMTGLSTEEQVFQKPYLELRLGQARPGEILRNLLLDAHQSSIAWPRLQESIKELFGYELRPPNGTGAFIVAEYITRPNGPAYDIASAGSGFQQLLMLLTFLNIRKGSVLLLDEPDAHLHVLLQELIYKHLRNVARREGSQLIIATHSEVVIDTVEPKELCVLLDKPRMIATDQQRETLTDSLRMLSNTDIMLAMNSPGVLYTEGRTDIDILREWARILNHPTYNLFKSPSLFWKPIVSDLRIKGTGISARDHYEALKLLKDDLPALELVDGDSDRGITSSEITGNGFQRLRWKRYEIESYLVHPSALERYVRQKVGDASAAHADDLRKHFADNYAPAFLRDPLGDHDRLNDTKARTKLLPPALAAGGLPGLDYTLFFEIAAVMLPEEIHPEVKEKLDLIQQAFRL